MIKVHLISVFVKWVNQNYVLYIFAVTCVWNKNKKIKRQISLFIVCSFSIVLYYKSECYIMQAGMLFAPHYILVFDFNTAWIYQCMPASKFLTVSVQLVCNTEKRRKKLNLIFIGPYIIVITED